MAFKKTRFEISSRILKARMDKGYTQSNLADAVGVKQPAVAQWEQGETMPKLETLMAVSKELQQPLSYFFPNTVANHMLGDSLAGQLWTRIRYWWYRRNNVGPRRS